MTPTAGDIMRIYREIDPTTRQLGRLWYGRSHRDVARLARLAPRGIGRSRTAAILAVLSPQTQWAQNWEFAEKIVLAKAAGKRMPAIGGFPRNREKAWRIVGGEKPVDVVRGPKVTSFWRALAGDPRAVVLDIWMFRTLGLPDTPTEKVYWATAEAFGDAADSLRVSARDLQASIWLHTRGVRPSDPIRYLEVAT